MSAGKPVIAAEREAAGASEEDARRRRERVKARWSMLRSALLGSDQQMKTGGGEGAGSGDAGGNGNGDSGRFHELSMNSFPGFRVLDRAVLPRGGEGGGAPSAAGGGGESWDVVRYTYTSTRSGRKVQFCAREAREQSSSQQQQSTTVKSRMEALLSHRTHGVDNTGNVRVWDAEGTLAGFLLSVALGEEKIDGGSVLCGSEESDRRALSGLRKRLRSAMTNAGSGEGSAAERCNLLELGSGQAGLAGLALASIASGGDPADQTKPLHVVLTDGHPRCVENNEVCASMMPKSDETTKGAPIEARLLLWDAHNGSEACRQINDLVADSKQTAARSADDFDRGAYHLCLASDCVHFQEFHDGLLLTVARTLAVSGTALLCQPKRGTSLRNFTALVEAVNETPRGPLFRVALLEDFCPKVSEMHASLTKERSPQYDPNWHRPLLLGLTKLRTYDEGIDGEVVRQHVKKRGEGGNGSG